MRNSILYYPHIELPDIEWLKLSLLLWDHVYRIVPAAYAPHDSDEVKVAVDSDSLRDAALATEDKRGITESFIRFMEASDITPAGLEYEEVAYLHPEKIDATLYPQLERYASGVSSDGFVELPKELVRGYMYFLASKVAERRQLDRCTDDDYSFAVSSFFSEDGNFSEHLYNPEAAGFYSSLIFQDLLPLSMSNVPIKTVIDAARRSRDEREQFRVQLLRFAEQLANCQDEEHQKMILNDYRNDLVKAKADLKAAHGFLNKTEQGSLLAVGLPAAAGFMSLLGNSPYELSTIAPSVLLAAIAAFYDYRRTQRATRFNPHGAAYLVSLDRRFSGTGVTPRFDRYLEEFIND